MQFFISRSKAGFISVDDGAMYLRKIRVNARSKKEGQMIEAESFAHAMDMAETLLPKKEEEKPVAKEPNPRHDPEWGRYYLMKADEEHSNLNWIGQYLGIEDQYKEQEEPYKIISRPRDARLYEVQKVYVWEKV